jgi:hypothetical protein
MVFFRERACAAVLFGVAGIASACGGSTSGNTLGPDVDAGQDTGLDATSGPDAAAPDASGDDASQLQDSALDSEAAADSGVAMSLVPGGVIASVAPDQSRLAYYTNLTTVAATQVGDLKVTSLPVPDAPTSLASGAYAAAFAGGGTSVSTLYFYTGATPSVVTGSTTVYGALSVWTASLTGPVALTTGFATYHAVAADNSFVIFLDSPTASSATAGDVVLVHAANCAGTTCTPTTLATGVVLTGNPILSNDATLAAYVTKSGTAPNLTYTAWLVDVAAGTQTSVATSNAAQPVAFSPDGTLFATSTGAQALDVISTTTRAPTTWGALPTGAKVLSVEFGDSAHLYVRADDATNVQHVYQVTASAPATSIATPVQAFELPHNAGTTTAVARYLIANSTAAAGVGNLALYDLDATTPMPVELTSMGGTATVSEAFDQTKLRFLDGFDETTDRGVLTEVTLPAGTTLAIANDIYYPTVSGYTTAADELFYLDDGTTAGTMSIWKNGATATLVNHVDKYIVRGTPTANLYFSNSIADTLLGLAPGIYVTPRP